MNVIRMTASIGEAAVEHRLSCALLKVTCAALSFGLLYTLSLHQSRTYMYTHNVMSLPCHRAGSVRPILYQMLTKFWYLRFKVSHFLFSENSCSSFFIRYFFILYFDHNFASFSREEKIKGVLPLIQGELVGDDDGRINLPRAHQRLEQNMMGEKLKK